MGDAGPRQVPMGVLLTATTLQEAMTPKEPPMPASNTPAPERPTHVRVLSHQHGDNLTTGRVYQVLRWLDDRPVIRFNGGYEVSLSHTTWEPAPAPSGPETPWERYMRQEWPMDRDRFNALVAAEVERAAAEWKVRAEKAEKERDALKIRGDGHAETLRSILYMAKADTPDAARIAQWCRDGLSGYVEPQGVTQAKLQDDLAAAEIRAEKAEAERDRYKREADDYEEREAACCPEDVGFDEFIAALKKRAERAEADHERVLRLLRQSESEYDDQGKDLEAALARAKKAEAERMSLALKVCNFDDHLTRTLARAEKAEAALRGAVGCMPTGVTQAHEERRPVRWFVENTSGMWLHKNGEEHTRTPIEAMSFRTREDAEREIERLSMASARPHATRSFYRATSHLFLEDADVMMSRASVTQAHEEAGARVARKAQWPDEIAAIGQPQYVSLHAWGEPMPKTQEPPSGASIPNQGTAPNASPAGGSATPTWAALRPWLAFVEAMAVDVARPSNGSAKRWRDAARALLAEIKKEGK